MWLVLTACVPHLYTDGDTDTDAVVWTAPDNDWPTATPPAELAAEGWADGQVPPDVRLVDQHGDTVSLWQFYGNVVLVDVSTMWCAPCRELGATAQATQDDYADQGFVYLTILSEDVAGDPPDVEDLGLWGDGLHITNAPIVSDATHAIATELTPANEFPVLLVLGRDLAVRERVPTATDEAVRGAIEAHLE